MAVSKGQKTVDAVSRVLYEGMGAVKVLGVNMSKAELEKIYGREIEEEPKYLGESTVRVKGADGTEEEKKYPNVRVTFIVETDPEKCNGIDTITNHTFFLQKRYRQNNAGDKFQVIDKYGRTAWATRAEIEAHTTELTKNDGTKYQANIDKDYRPAFVGEEALTLFIKNYLNIANVMSYVNGQWVPNPKVDAADCEVRLDSIEKYFKGDFKELKEIANYQPDNLVWIMFGVRTTDENRQYQTTYTDMCYKAAVTDFSKLDAEIQNRKNSGYLRDTDYSVAPLHEYVVEASTPTLEEAAASTLQPGEADPWA